MPYSRYFIIIFIFLIIACRPNTPDLPGNIKNGIERQGDKIIIHDLDHITEDKIKREDWQRPEFVVSKLGNLSNKTVVDIGPGYGFWLVYLVQEAEKVIGVDIDENAVEWLNHIKLYYSKEIQKKIDIRLVEAADPKLEENEVDAVLIVNTIPYIQEREMYFKNLRKAISKNGLVLVVDYKLEDLAIDAPPVSDRLDVKILEQELIDAGLQIVEVDQFSLPYQYMIIAMDPS